MAIAFVAATGFAPAGLLALVATLALRGGTASATARIMGDANLPRLLPLLPVSDLMSFVLWALSFAGNTVEWRGRKFRLEKGGRLTEIPQQRGGRRTGDPPGEGVP